MIAFVSPTRRPDPLPGGGAPCALRTWGVFTVSDDATTASPDVTYNLKAAKPFVRPRPDGKPHIGATVVETDFEVKDCSSGRRGDEPADEHRARGGL